MIPDVVLLAGASGTIAVLTAAAASTSDGGGSIAPYLSSSPGVVAVLALGEVTRRLLNGRLIPRETKDAEAEMGAAIAAAAQREALVMKIAEDATTGAANIAADLKRENAQIAEDLKRENAKLAADVFTQMGAMTRAVEDVRDELRQARRKGEP